MDETALIRGLQAGDRRALEEAVGQYTHYLTAVAARAMAPAPTREDLEEVVSDTFLALWRFRENLDPERPLRPWLAVAARNLAVSRLRGRKETQDIPDTSPTTGPAPRSWPSARPSTASCGTWWRRCPSPTAPCFCATTTRRNPWARWPGSWAWACPPPKAG